MRASSYKYRASVKVIVLLFRDYKGTLVNAADLFIGLMVPQ